MCGITGFWHPSGNSVDAAHTFVKRMSNAVLHRGPDDAGTWVDEDVGIALAHQRLSILDLTPAGHQPMRSTSERYVMVFNGEIYNHLELRSDLEKSGEAPAWRGSSDTETLLAIIDAWGIEVALSKSVGMFAFAVWDRHAKKLIMARDRIGEKPLYYGWVKGALVFSSELKAIRAYPGFDNEIERRALALYMRYNYVPTPWSIYKEIWKLPPGSWVEFKTLDQSGPGKIYTYWSTRKVAEAGLIKPFVGTPTEATWELERLLKQAIAGQMVADVPLGAFLSGGIDSSTVVALMQAQSERPVKTFTIGFHEGEYNEAEHAKAVAHHLGTEHTEFYVTPKDALDVIPQLPMLWDEPFADSSQIPTFLVAQLARRHVTVALSGDGGDEFFGGYNRYFLASNLWSRLSCLPGFLQQALASILSIPSPTQWNSIFRLGGRVLPKRLRYSNPGEKLHKLSGVLAAGHPESLYLKLVTNWDDPAKLVRGGEEPITPVTDPTAWLECPDIAQKMMYLDMITYLPDDILVKVDRASMGVSLETRAPILDHRVAEFAWRLPMSMKIHDDQGKWLLRQILYKYVPRQLIERPKMGFGIPIDHWLRGPLREWAENLLSEERLTKAGFFNAEPIKKKWAEHLSGKRNWQYLLWNVLMFEAWRDHFRD